MGISALLQGGVVQGGALTEYAVQASMAALSAVTPLLVCVVCLHVARSYITAGGCQTRPRKGRLTPWVVKWIVPNLYLPPYRKVAFDLPACRDVPVRTTEQTRSRSFRAPQPANPCVK